MATHPGKRPSQKQAKPATAGQHPEVTDSQERVAISGVYRQTPEDEWHKCNCHIWEYFEVRRPESGGGFTVIDVITACAYCGAPRCESHDLEASVEANDANRCVWERHHNCAPRHRQHEFPSGRTRGVGS